MKHELPKLSYSYDALEPYIDAKTMEIHHSKHHQGYVNKYVNALEGKYDNLLEKDVEEVLRDLNNVPEDVRTAVRNNGGGYFNHRLFWTVMGPNKGGKPTGKLMEAIEKAYGSFEKFQEEFENAAATQFGSGWAWLVTKNNEVMVTKTPNQDVPFDKGTPILALDVWEHAYYLNYQNKRPDYIKAFWNIVDWDQVSEYFEQA